jgi:hypothetical protein
VLEEYHLGLLMKLARKSLHSMMKCRGRLESLLVGTAQQEDSEDGGKGNAFAEVVPHF